MYIKDTMGNVGEAFNLIMRKEFAYPILKGEKKIEFRDTTKPKYAQMFFLKSAIQDKDDPDYLKQRKIYCVHAHDYGNTWFLDFSIEAIDIMALHYENAKYFHDYGHHEFDELFAVQKAHKVKPHDPDVQWWYCLPISGIINTNLDLSQIGEVQAYCIPDDYIITDRAKLKEAEIQFSTHPISKKSIK